jgi:hypothetical protein
MLTVELNAERLTALLKEAKDAHSRYEAANPDGLHTDWPEWYAAYMLDRAKRFTVNADSQLTPDVRL